MTEELTEETFEEHIRCNYTYVITSGYFNPLHSAHLDYLQAAELLGDFHIVILNNDNQVKVKNAVPFMNQEERKRILTALDCVDEVVLSIDEDLSIAATLEKIIRDLYRSDINECNVPEIRPNITFANGGDRRTSNPQENHICNRYGVVRKFGVGGNDKTQASSKLIEDAAKAWAARNSNRFLLLDRQLTNGIQFITLPNLDVACSD